MRTDPGGCFQEFSEGASYDERWVPGQNELFFVVAFDPNTIIHNPELKLKKNVVQAKIHEIKRLYGT
jgi:hypothetical protein